MTIIALAALLCPASSNADDYVSRVWVADQGDGTYINPIIHANYRPEFGFPTPYGYMRVYSHELSENFVNLWEVPNLLLQKFPAEEFTVTAKVKISSKADGQQSGLIVMGHDYCTLGLEKNGEKFDLV